MKITAAVFVYNSARFISATLAALARQQIPPGIEWDLLIIDNGSTDNTLQLVRAAWAGSSVPLRIVHEPQTGVMYARRLAAREATGEIMALFDHDNHPDPDWIANCAQFMQTHPKVGIVAGKIDPLFLDPAAKPADFDEYYAEPLVVRDLSPQPMRLVLPQYDPPPTAAMGIRTALMRQVLCDIGCFLSCREGNLLTNGGDTEMGLLAQRLGWETWYVPALRIQHLLPPHRLTESYLSQLLTDGARADAWLNYLRGREPRRSRLGYLIKWMDWRRQALKMSLLGRLRRHGHPHSARYPFWRDLFLGRAVGNWELFIHYPARKLEQRLQQTVACQSAGDLNPSPSNANNPLPGSAKNHAYPHVPAD